MLGQGLDQLPFPTIEKLGARKYGLVDEAGEVLEQFSTLKQAKKGLEAEQGRIREAAIARAKRMRDNATNQPQVWTPRDGWRIRRGRQDQVHQDAAEVPGRPGTEACTNYELSQTQMSEFAKGLGRWQTAVSLLGRKDAPT